MKRLIASGIIAVIIAVIHFSGNVYIKNVIKEDLIKKGYYIPNALLPTREVLEYLKNKEK